MFERTHKPEQNPPVRQQKENEAKQKKQKDGQGLDFLKYTPNFGSPDNGQVQKRGEQDNQPTSPGNNLSSSKLPDDVQAKMQHSFGTSFNDVNIHTNDKSANDLGALAYTQGADIHFAPGQYAPQSKKGQELLGHELAHVVQQREGKVKPPPTGDMQPTVARKTEKQLKKEEQ